MSVLWNDERHLELHPEPRSKRGRRFNLRATVEAQTILEMFKEGGSSYEQTLENGLMILAEHAIPMCAPGTLYALDGDDAPKIDEEGCIEAMIGFPLQNWNTVLADIIAQGGSVRPSLIYPPRGTCVHPITGRLVLWQECYIAEYPASFQGQAFALWIVTDTLG